MRDDPGTEFDDFVRASSPRLLALGRLLTGDPARAEDLVQEAYARAYLRWDTIEMADPTAYVRRCVINAHADWWRRRPWRERPAEAVPDRGNPRDAMAAWDSHADLVTALATLTRRERTVVVLRYFAQLSESEIAAELGVPPGTVKSTAHRALGKLRASPHLHPAGEEATR